MRRHIHGNNVGWEPDSLQSQSFSGLSSYTPDEAESPNNTNTFRSNASSQSFRKTISDWYGPETVSKWRNLEKQNIKLPRVSNHLTLMCGCRDNNNIPKGLQIKVPVKTKKAKLIQKRTSRALLRERISFHRRSKKSFEVSINNIEPNLRTAITSSADLTSHGCRQAFTNN